MIKEVYVCISRPTRVQTVIIKKRNTSHTIGSPCPYQRKIYRGRESEDYTFNVIIMTLNSIVIITFVFNRGQTCSGGTKSASDGLERSRPCQA